MLATCVVYRWAVIQVQKKNLYKKFHFDIPYKANETAVKQNYVAKLWDELDITKLKSWKRAQLDTHTLFDMHTLRQRETRAHTETERNTDESSILQA